MSINFKHMKNLIYTFIGLLIVAVACEPRIDLDLGQFGDRAFINRVIVFELEGDEHELQEFAETGVLTPGIRRNVIDLATSIDSIAATAISTVPTDTDLTNVAIGFLHEADRIEPLDGAPRAGFLADFSNSPYRYRLFSADGTIRDWAVTLQPQ